MDTPIEVTPEVIETPVETVDTAEPTTPTEVETPVAEVEDLLAGLSDEDLTKIINDITSQKPAEDTANFPAPVDKSGNAINDLLELEKIVDKTVEQDSRIQELTTQLSDKEAKEAEALETVAAVESTWNLLATSIPWLESILEGLTEWREDAIPLHYKQENWERVESNPIIGPFVNQLLKGENPNFPDLLRQIAKIRSASMPNTSEIENLPTDTFTQKESSPYKWRTLNYS